MLASPVFIFNPSLVSGSTYTLDLYFELASQAKFARHGDIITDTNSNTYQITGATTLPLSDGSTITVSAVGPNVLPEEDSNYDSEIETPGQVDSRAEVVTGGTINTATLISGPDYTYLLTASWDSPSQSNLSTIGDSVVDSLGKEYRITAFTNILLKWGDSVTVEEVEKIGQTPAIGQGSLFRATSAFKLYQGSPISDPARTLAYNRDNFLLDDFLAQISSASGKTLEGLFLNNTGTDVTPLRVVDQDSSGNIRLLNLISDEARVDNIVGVTKAAILTGNQGVAVLAGLIEDITTSFVLGDELFLSPVGLLTKNEPEVGLNGFTAGDFIVKVGQITKNASNPSAKDLLVKIEVRGQL